MLAFVVVFFIITLIWRTGCFYETPPLLVVVQNSCERADYIVTGETVSYTARVTTMCKKKDA